MRTIMQTRSVEPLWDVAGAEHFRLDRLSKREKNALEEDLELVLQVQRGLLPQRDLACDGWRAAHYYEPAGLVSGDYCDVVDAAQAGVYFMVGDVCGKGVAASFVTAHLHGMFRALISMELPVKLIVEHINRALCRTNLPYATLVCGRARSNGAVEICNAGHPAPLVVRDGYVTALEESGLPAGMFADEEFSAFELSLEHGESLVLYSDGVSEARDFLGLEYGAPRLRKVIGERHAMHPSALVGACRDDLAAFRRGAEKADDLTILVLGRDAPPSLYHERGIGLAA